MEQDEEDTGSDDSENVNSVDENEKTSLLLPSTNQGDGPKEVEETSKIGTVSKLIYWGYFKAGANLCTGFVVILATIGQGQL